MQACGAIVRRPRAEWADEGRCGHPRCAGPPPASARRSSRADRRADARRARRRHCDGRRDSIRSSSPCDRFRGSGRRRSGRSMTTPERARAARSGSGWPRCRADDVTSAVILLADQPTLALDISGRPDGAGRWAADRRRLGERPAGPTGARSPRRIRAGRRGLGRRGPADRPRRATGARDRRGQSARMRRTSTRPRTSSEPGSGARAAATLYLPTEADGNARVPRGVAGLLGDVR